MQKSGVFVTLNSVKREPALRGCVGYPQPIEPLAVATIRAAIRSATQDPRFPPVRLEEFQNDIAVELSVLTPPELISVKSALDYAGEIAVGKHGLIVELNGHAGLLLPQVASEWKWDPEEFLSQTCLKANLPPDAWLLNGTRIQRFEAVIFAETKPGGPIVLREEGWQKN